MNLVADLRVLDRLDTEQRGVWSTADLTSALAEPHAAAFSRRVRQLVDAAELSCFTRGFYVRSKFDLPTLSQRIAPESYISFGTVLARELIIGTDPARQVVAVKIGRTRRYVAQGMTIEHVGTTPELFFGYASRDGVSYADPEKAVLDTLYYHLRGRRYPFDIFSDLAFGRLNQRRLRDYLGRYKNPKFVLFAQRLLGLS